MINLREAATKLTAGGDRISRPSLSRYVQQHADALHPTRRGRETFVDFEVLKAHREDAMRHRVELLEASIKKGPAERTRADEARDKLAVDRQIREIDLQERHGQLTRVSEVQEAAAGSLTVLRAAFATATEEAAGTLAALTSRDAGLIRPHLQALEKRSIDAYVRVLVDRNLLASAAPVA